MPITTTPGNLILRDTLPEDVWRPGEEIDGRNVGQFLEKLVDSYPDKYKDIVQRLHIEGAEAATVSGRAGSAGLSDLKLPESIVRMRMAMRAHVRKLAQSDVPEHTKNDHIVAYLEKMAPKMREAVVKAALEDGNAFALAAAKGFRSNPEQITQMLFGNMLMYDSRGRPIPVPGLTGYGEGVSPMEYWAGSYTSRKGYWDQQFATAQSGYLGKKMSFASQRMRITGDDCGTTDGIEVDGEDSENVGALLARPIGSFDANHAVRKEDIKKLGDKKILVRSPITCALPEGVCKKCAGKRENNDFPEMGSFVGVTSARVLSEPLIQTLALSSKHTGTSSSIVGDEDISGLKEIIQYVNVPERFRGAAILSHVDGRVEKVSKAPQGGWWVDVGSARRHVPPYREVKVKAGDIVEQGDSLTDGTPNPAELGSYKGLGAARLEFARGFRDMLKRNRVPGHRRHIETLAKSLYDRVRITDPEGWNGYLPGDYMSYSRLAADYVPRKGSTEKATTQALGGFMERPTLHYTIGTRITPSVINDLKKAGIGKVMVHSEQPIFAPAIARVEDLLQRDPDWRVRLSSFGLKRSLLDAARHGSEGPEDTLSYVPMLMDATRIK